MQVTVSRRALSRVRLDSPHDSHRDEETERFDDEQHRGPGASDPSRYIGQDT